MQHCLPEGVCVKAKNLRPKHDNLREWMANSSHVYVGRRGRIFIKERGGGKHVFHYKDSEWCNPFKLTEYSLEESLEKYENYLCRKLDDDPDALERFRHLSFASEIGCFCDPSQKCHRDVILKILREIS